MEDILLKQMWAAYDKKLEKSLALNHRLVTEIQTQKARTALRPLKAIKIVAVILGIIWSLFLSILVVLAITYMTPYSLFFILSAMAVIVITVTAIVVYIRQVALIQQIDNDSNILDTQKKLVRLQLSTISIVRILMLSAPFYTTFYFNKGMFENGTIGLWVFQLTITLLFSALSIWFYQHARIENADKRWFKIIFGSSEWTALTKAQHFLQEIEAYEKE
ncbi:hypothetical protein SAMN05428949_5021 [Chitinophaga sp. YR627]|uniref:hypothetical protein n=1 Tax=Chitinophaga sp. YR627 TaxID=1881041 RepID=UPI0008EF4905|nr:hypothetical protein [Chitinophaga sp. YR627]SFO34312.1 hypothetical protein SAMN05428949_5021 [Chitinophaga sp. YR627]